MARLPLIDETDPATDPTARTALAAIANERGNVLNVYRGLANNPAALEAIHALSMATRTFSNGQGSGSLTPAQSELAYTATTVANRCFYWVPTHIVLGRSAGLSDAKLAHLADDPVPADIYAPEEIAIVRYARESTLRIVIDDPLHAELERHFTARQILDLCLIVGLSNLINRFHATFHTDVDAATLAALERGGEIPIDLPVRPGE